jgi:hypothetical protein
LRCHAAGLDLQLERRPWRQGERKLGVDHHIANLQRHQAIRRLPENQRFEHLPGLEQRRLGRGRRDGNVKLGLDGGEHHLTLPDSG